MLPAQRVLIVAIDDGGEAHALREVVENFGVAVDFVGIGETRDLIAVLNARRENHVTVLCGHGDGGLLMPELGEPLASQQPFQGPLTAEQVRKHLDLHGRRVLCTGCATGVEALGAAFVDAGCEWFVAPDGDPNGAEAFMFAVHFLYLLLHRGLNAVEAVEQARCPDDDRATFRIFS